MILVASIRSSLRFLVNTHIRYWTKTSVSHIIVLLLTSGSLKAPAGLYVLHLAVADSLLLISLPFAADNRLRGTWIFGRIACKIMESMKLLNFFSSIFLLTLMGKNHDFLYYKPKL